MTLPTDLIPLSSIAKRLRVSATRLERLALVGDFPSILNIGGALRVRESEVVEWLRERDHAAVVANREVSSQQVRTALRSRADLRRP
jgi:predicted site-specific integrase-resolvase